MNRKEKSKKKEKEEISYSKKEVLINSLKLPKDTLLGASIVTMIGNREVIVENYRGILEYTSENILLQGKSCQIIITGDRLHIDYYTNEDMKISGMIREIRYQ